jgi:hypothetical protein
MPRKKPDKVYICCIEGCNKQAAVRGLCAAHYAQWLRGKEIPTLQLGIRHSKKQHPIKDYKQVPIEKLAYAAGIIDGEGCIRIGKYLNSKKEIRYRGSLIVCMTDIEAVKWLHNTLGGNLYTERSFCAKNKLIHSWVMRTAEANALLTALIPYLIVKRRQAQLLLEFSLTVKLMGKKGHSPELHAKRAQMAALSHQLNRKGRIQPHDALP